jgi:phosphoserine aminotransferase
MARRNEIKAAKLYAYIDESPLFRGTADRDSRSLMNVTFVTGNEALDKRFIAFAQERGLDGLKGHRSVGGMRASIYNAFPAAGVDALVSAMREFEQSQR